MVAYEKGKKKEALVKGVPCVVIQFSMGGSNTVEKIITKVGRVETVCIRVDENKAYWVRGDEAGSADLW